MLSRLQSRIVLAFLLFGAVLAGAYVVYGHTTLASQTHIVELRDGAFLPAEVAITEGDTVIFRNVGSKDAWPASDPHPTHEYLSGFDPRRALAPGDEWAHTFTEPGSWRYHDHLAPITQGEVIVLTKDGRKNARYSGNCDGKCFDELVRHVVEDEGIDAAYALFQSAYAAGELPRSCHWTAHKIGEAAYELYREGRDFSITTATSFCGFGFYHGFLEGLLREDPSPDRALIFCDSVAEKLGLLGLQNCYHGIGHGFTEDPPEPAAVGSMQKMIEPGIRMCEFLFGKDFTNLNLCLTGVFTVPAGFAAENAYGLSIDPANPFSNCNGQPIQYKKACYGEFAPKLDLILEWDLTRLPRHVDKIQDERLKRLVVWVVPSVFMAKHIQNENIDRYITGCREAFSGRYRNICWGGAILGIYSHGEPQKQYEKAFAFCSSNAWKDSERPFCWGESLRQARQTYGTARMSEVCASVPQTYKHLCLDEGRVHVSPYDDPSFEQS